MMLETTEGSVEAAVIEGSLRALSPGARVLVSLTAEGERIAERLGSSWFARAIAPLALAHPQQNLELLLKIEDSEPMAPPAAVLPALAGDLYRERRAVGRVSIRLDGPAGAPVTRALVLPGERLLDGDGEFHFVQPVGFKRRLFDRVYGELYRRTPLLLDVWRQQRNSMVERRRAQMVPAAPALRSAGRSEVLVEPRRPVAWLALHWLEPGGAESWALESAELAVKAGFRVILTVDVPAPQRLLQRALAITPEVYLAANSLSEADWEAFLSNLLERERPDLVHIHHSRRAYSVLPEIRHIVPGATVIDSVHIIEHRTGGYVRQSIESSDLIDVHHVISPELRDVYRLGAEIGADKIAYHPLTSGVTAEHTDAVTRAPGPLRIGFLGRLVPQKRPFLFVALASRLHRAFPGEFAFVIQGDGALGPMVAAEIRKARLVNVVEQVPWGPVERFMDSVDVLVISSDNEGLTLTTLEAEEHGVLVLSADVGSQRSVIAPDLLVPRAPHAFLKAAASRLHAIAASPEAYDRARAQQSELVRCIAAVEPASTHFASYYSALEENH